MRKDSNPKVAPIASAIALFLTACLAGTAYAQATIDEIVVTARKVEESLQDVSLSITAFTSADIQERSIDELDDVAMLTPGLSYEDYSNAAFGTPIIRGASQFSVAQLEQNVSTFLDGIYIPRQYAIDIGTLGLERVEVVKGPQSALYGANAFMGAINYVSTAADLEEFSATINGNFGSDERQDLSASLSFPVMPGVLAVQLGMATTEFDGDWANDHPGANAGLSLGTDGNLGGWDNESYSVDIVAQPSDALSIELAYKNFEVVSETRPQSRLTQAGGDLNCGNDEYSRVFSPFFTLTIPGERAYCGELPDTPLVGGTTTEQGFLIDPRTFGMSAENEFTRFSLSYDLSDSMSVVYNHGKVEGTVFAAGIADRDPIGGQLDAFTGLPNGTNAFNTLPFGGFESKTNEIRLEGTMESGLYWMVGGFSSEVQDTETTLGQGGGIFAPLYDDAVTPEAFTRDSLIALASAVVTDTTTVDTTAYFGRVSMPFMDDKLVVALEGRFTDEDKVVDTLTETYSESYFTPRVSVDYKLSEDQLLYLSYAEGVKSGGINTSTVALTDEELQYGTDENTTFEIGSKNTLVDGRLQLNAAIYQIDWSNLQISASPVNGDVNTATILQNIGSAESSGFELELAFLATENLTLRGGLALNDASYDSGTVSQRVARAQICADVVCSADGDVSGNDLPRSSETQWSIGARYDGMISELDYYISTDIAGQSEQYVSELNLATIPSRSLINLNVGLSGEAWSAELWVKNLADEEYVSNAFYINSPFFVDYVPTWGAKRRMGLDLSYSF